jgi:hypothetical protein
MAKSDLEIKVIPDEARILFAGIAMHAYIASGKSWSAESIALQSFDVAEKMIEEGKKRDSARKR